ncbi:MAG: PilZ domain-containing protein [Proteobacteria bacterium]|nr:PilZ domain-containing protein [Pseudomonadota bacterium]
MTEKPNRNFFRLEYPKEVMPLIEFAKGHYKVINLSEHGVKFSINTKELKTELQLEAEVRATIVFKDAQRTNVSGKILRIDSDSIVLVLSDGVPLQRIMTEQRFLLAKFGNLRLPSEPPSKP